MKNFRTSIFIALIALFCVTTSVNAQPTAGQCSVDVVKEKTKRLKQATSRVERYGRQCVTAEEKWNRKEAGYHQREGTYEDQLLEIALNVSTIQSTLGAFEAIFNGVLCLTGVLSPNECRDAKKDFDQAVARIASLERKVLNIELKLQATRSKREAEFGFFTIENGRCLDRVATNQTQVTELTAQLETCRNVSIASPNSGASVNTSFNVRVKPQVVSIVPKGIVEPNSGYLVVILDGPAVPAGGAVPAGALELVGGETRVRLTVPLAGAHTVVVQLFNGDGTAFTPQMFDTVNVNVN